MIALPLSFRPRLLVSRLCTYRSHHSFSFIVYSFMALMSIPSAATFVAMVFFVVDIPPLLYEEGCPVRGGVVRYEVKCPRITTNTPSRFSMTSRFSNRITRSPSAIK